MNKTEDKSDSVKAKSENRLISEYHRKHIDPRKHDRK